MRGAEHRIVWNFRPAPGREAEFLAAYGEDGAWVRLFRRGEGYLGTRLQPLADAPGTWRTVDRWRSAQAYQAFRQRYAREYAALDAECEALTEFEQAVETPGMNTTTNESRAAWLLMIVAATILTLTMGVRQSLGLFVAPIHDSAGLSIATISFALAVGQLIWGVAQPLFGMYADRHGSVGVVRLGGLMLAGGLVLVPFLPSQWGLLFGLGILSAAGAGAGSFSILIGATSRLLPPERRPFAAGFINAGGSFGQFLFAPLTQAIIAAAGWAAAMFTLAATSLLTLPLARFLRVPVAPAVAAGAPPVAAGPGLGAEVRRAFADRSYWCLHLGFFTCGLHIAFLVTHLPGEVALCGLSANVSAVSLALIGLFNIAGSLSAGALGQRYRMKYLLAGIYASRALMIAIYLVSPRTPLTFYVFAAALGFTWLATVPPTAGLVGKLFGTRYLATLFGLTLLSHQIGGFFGAWLGGLTISRFGDYNWMWYLDIGFALLAAVANLPIREERLVPRLATV